MTNERIYLLPTPRIYQAVDTLICTAPETVYIIPGLLIDEIVRSAFYWTEHTPSHYGVIPGLVQMDSRDNYAVSFIDLAEEIVAEATADLADMLCFHDIGIGDLVDYSCSQQTRTVALRVWDYGIRKY